MFQLQFVIGLFLGFVFNIMHIVLNAPINAEKDLEPDYNAIEARSLFGKPDRSMNGAVAYEEIELENIFINPEEMGPYLEGDIIISDDFETDLVATKLWPNGVVPFQIAANFSKNKKKRIMTALQELTSKTCLQFPKRTVEEDYVYFIDHKAGCSSKIGHQGGQQFINLNAEYCFDKIGTIVHELLHSVGFYHEHARNDRDSSVKIIWANIKPGHAFNFNKIMEKIVPSVDLTYDYGSIMHYSRYGFAIDGRKETITPLFNTTDALIMGQRVGLSPLDIKKVNAKYHCKDTLMTEVKDKETIKVDNNTNVHFALKGKTLQLEFNFNLNLTSFQFTSGNTSLDLKYKASDFNNE